FCATETVLCFTPGPAVLLVVATALSRGARGGFAAALGILAANSAYFVLSGTGVGAVLATSRNLFLAIKWVVAGYLVCLGLGMILWPRDVDRGEEAASDTSSRRGLFWRGLATQAANPKSIVFFTALLPQFIDPGSGVAKQVVILGMSSVLIELIVLSIYIAACHAARQWTRAPSFAAPLQRLCGSLLVVAGARLATAYHA